MQNSTIVFLINDDARAVRAVYEDSTSGSIFKTFDQTIKVDDLLVVESSTRHLMTVVKVTDVDVDINFDMDTDVKWVVQKIAVDDFKEVLAQEQVAISAVQAAERKRKKDELRKALFKDHEEKLAALQLANHEDDVTE